MAADDKILIEIQLDDGSVQKGFIKIEKQAEVTGKKVGDSIQGGLSGAKLALSFKLAEKAIDAAIAPFKKFIALMEQSIEDANKQADAVNRLNIALGLTGKFSRETSKSLQDFASELQEVTKFGDETILEVASLIQTLGNLDEQGLKRATKAALDLSTALGIELNSATTLVAKAAAGQVDSFGRYGVVIQKGKTDAETFANALTALESKFGGSSEAAVRTYSGAFQQLKNTIGDSREQAGFLVTQSPALIAFFNETSKLVKEITALMKEMNGGTDVFKTILSYSITISAAFVSFFGPAIEGVTRAFEAFINVFKTGGMVMQAAVTGPLSILEKAFNKVFGTNLSAATNQFSKDMNNLKYVSNETYKSLTDSFGADGTRVILDKMAEFQGAVDVTSGKLNDLTMATKNAGDGGKEKIDKLKLAIIDLQTNAATSGQQFNLIVKGMRESINNVVLEGSAGFKKLGDIAFKGFVNGVGQGFAAFGRALAKGENALAAFTKAFLQSIGQAAIALGTEFILRGTAYLFVPGLQAMGGPLIAAGAALAAFGGFLGASIGGDSATVGSTSGGASPQTGSIGQTGELPETTAALPQTQVSLIVQGDILDSDNTASRITQLLQDYVDKNGQTVFV